MATQLTTKTTGAIGNTQRKAARDGSAGNRDAGSATASQVLIPGAETAAKGLSKRPFFRAQSRPRDAVEYLTPNWFATVMGTGIVANAAATLPLQIPGLRVAATGVWMLAGLMLVVLVGGTLAHWLLYPNVARGHHNHKVIGHFYGAVPMALMTVGAGTMLLGQDLIGHGPAVAVHGALWSLGTALGLFFAVFVPYIQFTRHKVGLADAFGGWLMPVVSPMVSAATGALLLTEIPEGQLRQTFMVGLYGCFGLTLIASMIVIPIIWAKLAVHGPGAAAAVPTFWILLGPMGQSVTAANLIGSQAKHVVGADMAHAFEAFGLIFGITVTGFALLWMAIAFLITLSTLRQGLPFSLTWWSFTFPVGTVVTGLSGLAMQTGLVVYVVLASAVFVGLVGVWGVVWTRTVLGSVVNGNLLCKPAL